MFQSPMDQQRASARPRIVVLGGGIGFTMSLFIARQAFPGAADFTAAKIAIFAASLLAGVIGTAVLWRRVPAPGNADVA